jgi:hypothetical protein
LTLKSLLTVEPGLAFNKMGRGEMAAANPGAETVWALVLAGTEKNSVNAISTKVTAVFITLIFSIKFTGQLLI